MNGMCQALGFPTYTDVLEEPLPYKNLGIQVPLLCVDICVCY